MKTTVLMMSLAGMLLTSLPGLTQTQNILETRYGEVVSKREIKGDSHVATGAMIGGLVGLLTASGESGGKKVVHTAGGALVGGVIANQVDKSKRYWQYTVRFPNGGETYLELQDDRLDLGDCAAVHFGVDQTTVNQASGHFCRPGFEPEPEPEPELIFEEIADEPQAGDPCVEAKRRLLNSNDKEESAILIEKIKIICG